MKLKFLFFLIAMSLTNLNGQSFTNGGLEGDVIFLSELPDCWDIVPYTDINCVAGNDAAATPDLVSTTDPDIPIGLAGIANSGKTFVGGTHGLQANGVHVSIVRFN